MISIYRLKPAFQNQLRPIVNWLANHGITANAVTVSAAILSLLAGSIIAIWHQSRLLLLIVPVVLFVRMALNAIDGMLAREHGQKSHLGAILNELGDVISDAGLYLPFALLPGVNAILVVPVVVLAIVAEMSGILRVTNKIQRQYDGPMGKSDRALVFGTVALLLALGVTPGLWLNILWCVVISMLVLTIVNRGRSILREIEADGINPTTE